MNVVLVIWTVVAIHGSPGTTHDVRHAWRPLMDLNSAPACHEAARQLALDKERYRCLSKLYGTAV